MHNFSHKKNIRISLFEPLLSVFLTSCLPVLSLSIFDHILLQKKLKHDEASAFPPLPFKDATAQGKVEGRRKKGIVEN